MFTENKEATIGNAGNEKGSGANYFCLPEHPQYSTYTAETQAQDG